MGQLYQDLLQSLQEAKDYLEGKPVAVRVHHFHGFDPINIKSARKKLKMTQMEFAEAFGVSPNTLRNWETGRRTPEGAARVLLKVIEQNPQAVIDAVRT